MIETNERILVLAEPELSDALTQSFGQGRPLAVSNPYEALEKLSQRRWNAVVLSVKPAEDDFPGMCRATRRLCGQDNIYAVCAPEDEPQVRPLVGELIEDYFINPPTVADVRRVCGRVTSPGQMSGNYQPTAATSADTMANKFASLIDSTQSVADLENRLAEVMGNYLNRRVWWTDADKISSDTEPILLAAGDVPRVLMTDKAVAGEAYRDEFIETVQQCLPSLMAAAKRAESLHRLAVKDHLTGAYNRRYFYHLTDQILAQAESRKYRVTLLLYDIDDFKRYNDTYGHAAGDEVLKSTAAIMKRITRSHDVVARIGGDEFVVLFWDPHPRAEGSQPPRNAYVLANRFCQLVAKHQFPSLGPEGEGVLTISGGLANFPADGQTCRELLRSADKALRQAKKSGKNNILLVGGQQQQQSNCEQ